MAVPRVPEAVYLTFIALEPIGHCPYHQASFSVAFKAMVPTLLKQYTACVGHPDTCGSTTLHLAGHACANELCHEASCALSKDDDSYQGRSRGRDVGALRLEGSVSGFLPMQRTIHAP